MYGPSGRGRGQPVQIGVLLIFAFLIIALAFFQAVLVPQENAQVEFNHNQNLQDDMVDLRSDLLRSAATGEARTTQVRLGTTYPTRTLLLNPTPPGGTLRSTHRGNLSITNARATSSTGVEDFWDGDDATDDPAWVGSGETRHTFRTNALLYEPSYNVYGKAPETVFGGSVLYNRFPDENLALSNQTFVNGRTITLTAVQGDYSESTNGAVTVDPRVVSPINRTVTVTDTGDPVTLRVPTRLSEETWRDLLSGEMGDASDQHVESVSVEDGPAGPNDVLVVTLEAGVSYNLQLGAVAVGSRGPTEGAEHDPEYLVVAGGNGNSIDEGDTQRLTLEVRDRYNNPVSGAEVTVQQPTVGYLVGSGGDPVTLTTDENGRVTATYAAPRNVRRNQDATFSASIPGSGDARTVELTVGVEDDSETVSNADYRRPLLSAVEPSPGSAPDASEEFVRVYVPESAPGGTYYVENAGGTRSAELVDPTAGEYYFSDGSFTGPCQGATNVNDLNFDLETTGTLTVVYEDGGETKVRDRLSYEEGETFDASGLGERIEEDEAYVDSNVSTVDWRTATASEACGDPQDDPPSFGSLSASPNINRQSGSNLFTDTVTFTYNVSDDRSVQGLALEVRDESSEDILASTSNGLETADSVAVTFSERQLSDDPVRVVTTVTDSVGQERRCAGVLDGAGQTLTKAEMDCSTPTA